MARYDPDLKGVRQRPARGHPEAPVILPDLEDTTTAVPEDSTEDASPIMGSSQSSFRVFKLGPYLSPPNPVVTSITVLLDNASKVNEGIPLPSLPPKSIPEKIIRDRSNTTPASTSVATPTEHEDQARYWEPPDSEGGWTLVTRHRATKDTSPT